MADVVVKLKTGGEIRGELVKSAKTTDGTHVIKTESGSLVTLANSSVAHVRSKTKKQIEYAKLQRNMPDTATGHWELAQWCATKNLLNERRRHIRRILELDPNHLEARRILGFRMIDGKWMSRSEDMQSRGYIKHEGDWRTPQDIVVRTRKKNREDQEIEWRKKIKRWYSWLGRRDIKKVQEAREGILGAQDPYAAAPMIALLKKTKDYKTKLLLLESLSTNPSPKAVDTLADYVVEDPSAEVRDRCLEYLVDRKYPLLVRRFTLLLHSNDNKVINRAAIVLGALKYDDAVSPLIDALVTKHKIPNTSAGRTSAGFSPQGGSGGLKMGGPKFINITRKNSEVRTALMRLTGQSFEYDETAWLRWHTSSQREVIVNLRRD